ncbi:MAG: GtrA family protein [Lachnospiraceae bacterium]|nr:GtrA family protein [Lachnospiraceae bacterium]MBR6848635.1 GtrA family protein [Lachnospiraceae bacterium]
MNRIRKILNYETITYVIVGVLTTVVDYLVFILVNEALKRAGTSGPDAAVTATAVSWVAAVLFAYIANKLVVFRNYDFGAVHILKEAAGFFAARIISGLISLFLMWLMTAVLHQNEYLAKVLTSVFNLVFNYVASKVFIFRH